MSYRKFDPEQEKLAAEWAKSACTTLQWTEGERLSTESKPFRVYSGDIAGYAKPGVIKPDKDRLETPRAAHETIVSGLACHLSLDVPRVILWDGGRKAGNELYVAISASAFVEAKKWDAGSLTADQKAAMAAQLWSIVPFEAWIAAEDRKADHAVVDWYARDAVAHIDYAFSMHRAWSKNKEPSRKVWFANDVAEPDGVVSDVVERIQAMEDAVIGALVRRIPTGFLNDGQKDIILANLLSRKQQLTSLMSHR
jgi:hypothetical protein